MPATTRHQREGARAPQIKKTAACRKHRKELGSRSVNEDLMDRTLVGANLEECTLKKP